MLNQYLQTVQGFVRDRGQKVLNPTDLISYINRVRREVAERAQCVRILTPVSGPITTIQVLTAGHGYTNPTITISVPDAPSGALPFPAGAQATADVQQIGGMISNISLVQGGDGYFQPTVTINDPTGTGATATAFTSPINVTQFQQEIYEFKNVPLQRFPGIDSIFAVKSVSIIYANYRYSLPCYSMTEYQSSIRQYPRAYLYVPTMCAQYSQGNQGSIYMYPIPSQPFQMEWDALCIPASLVTDNDYEAIPAPWTDAIPMGAAMFAFAELQNYSASNFWKDRFEEYCHKYSIYARPGRLINPYGR